MKRLLFILAFMLIGNFAFASDDVKDDIKKISTFDVEKALTNSLELMQCTFVIENNLTPIIEDVKNDNNVAFPCCVTVCTHIGGWIVCVTECGECIIVIIIK